MADLSTSDLNTPLGAPKPVRAPSPWPRRVLLGAAAVPAALIAAVAGYGVLVSDPDGGRPVASAEIRPAERRVATAPEPAAPSAPEAPGGPQTAGQLEDEAGVKVVRPGSEAPGAVVIRVPEPAGVRLAPAPDRRLTERGRHGLLPKVGEDGSRASRIYARPADPKALAAPVRIAVLLGGLGISSAATGDAIARLPADVSFAFAPYGGDLERQVQRARADGHEVFIQAPMEPFDYPDNDPGPHTLTVGAGAQDNLERLRWVLGRFPGYVGVVNFMGARFSADEAALGPVLRELAERGLMVVDDGSSARSLTPRVAAGYRAPVVKADVVLDLQPRAESIDRELARLEQIARDRGVAVASGSALPITIERLSRFLRAAEQRGVQVIPVSAVGLQRIQATGSIR